MLETSFGLLFSKIYNFVGLGSRLSCTHTSQEIEPYMGLGRADEHWAKVSSAYCQPKVMVVHVYQHKSIEQKMTNYEAKLVQWIRCKEENKKGSTINR